MEGPDVPRIPIQLTRDCLVASIQVDLTEQVLSRFQRELLEQVHQRRPAGVILDLSGVEMMDIEDFEALRKCARMTDIMGSRSVLVGLRPGVVSALVMMDVDTDGVDATSTLEDAFDLLLSRTQEAPEPAAGDGPDEAPLSDDEAGSADEEGRP